MNVKVFAGPIEIAGQMGILSKGLRSIGYEVDAYNIEQNYLGYNQNIHNTSRHELQNIFEHTKDRYDIFHFYYGKSVTDHDEDFRYIKDRNKIRLMHFWGNDVRTESIAVERNPYIRLSNHFLSESHIHKKLQRISKYMDACIVQDFEVVPYVLKYFERIYVLPLAIDLSNITPVPPEATNEPLLIHAPTLPDFKGTEMIEQSLTRLQNRGYRFRYERIQGLSNNKVFDLYAKADIILDQILCGSYGILAVEAMAFGKPVISFIRRDLRQSFDDRLPILSANPATIYQKTKRLLKALSQWKQYGLQGRKYVERIHDVNKVAWSLSWIYEMERSILADHTLQSKYQNSIFQLRYPRVQILSFDPKTFHYKSHSGTWLDL
jgi:hypothetical protein